MDTYLNDYLGGNNEINSKNFSIILITFHSYAKGVNVYLLFDSLDLYQSIKKFNSYLERNEILARYQIELY